MKPPALRTKLTLFYTGVLALLLVALGLTYYHVFARQVDLDADAELREMTSGVHGYLRFEGGMPLLAYDRNDPEQVAFVEEATRYYQVFDATSGRLLLQSPALEPLGVHYTPAEVHAFRDHPGRHEVQTDQRRIRFSDSVISPFAGERYLLQVGVPLDSIDNALAGFVRLLLLTVPIGLIIVFILGRWMAARALTPLARFAEATRGIDVTDLTRRLPVRGAGDELDEVARAFNGTLERLERAIGEMQQFSTALAHELRTPLAVLRGETELALMPGRSPEEIRRALTSQLEELDKLTRLINRLLTLARAEGGDIPLARESVDLAALSASVVEQLEPVAETRRIALTCEPSHPVMVTGDAAWLERLLLNLLDNAIKFTGDGGSIAVRVSTENGAARLDVRDSGVGIAADALPHLFQRFYQIDPSQSSQAAGAGLGLSLVKWIADRHGAAIDVRSAPSEGSTFTVRLPRRPEPSP